MKELFHAFSMCQSMFCRLPFPCRVWDEKARDKMLFFLPLIGFEIGLLWFLCAFLCLKFNIVGLVKGLILTFVPFILTGFIHVDGFMDVSDAVGSRLPLENRRKILKDSHVGSFAVINCVLLMIGTFAFISSLSLNTDYRIFILIPVVSRCCSVVAVSVLPKMETSQYVHTKVNRIGIVITVVIVLVSFTACYCMSGLYVLVLLGTVLGYILALFYAYKNLQGMNGDVSGYSLVISEFVSIIILYVVGVIL